MNTDPSDLQDYFKVDCSKLPDGYSINTSSTIDSTFSSLASPYTFSLPEESEWKCYLFGSTPERPSIVYYPKKDQVPNWFVRKMMELCFGCKWIKSIDKSTK